MIDFSCWTNTFCLGCCIRPKVWRVC